MKNIDEINEHLSDHIKNKALENENENEKVINKIKPMLAQIFEYESSQEFSSLVDRPQLLIYEFIVGLV